MLRAQSSMRVLDLDDLLAVHGAEDEGGGGESTTYTYDDGSTFTDNGNGNYSSTEATDYSGGGGTRGFGSGLDNTSFDDPSVGQPGWTGHTPNASFDDPTVGQPGWTGNTGSTTQPSTHPDELAMASGELKSDLPMPAGMGNTTTSGTEERPLDAFGHVANGRSFLGDRATASLGELHSSKTAELLQLTQGARPQDLTDPTVQAQAKDFLKTLTPEDRANVFKDVDRLQANNPINDAANTATLKASAGFTLGPGVKAGVDASVTPLGASAGGDLTIGSTTFNGRAGYDANEGATVSAGAKYGLKLFGIGATYETGTDLKGDYSKWSLGYGVGSVGLKEQNGESTISTGLKLTAGGELGFGPLGSAELKAEASIRPTTYTTPGSLYDRATSWARSWFR